MTFTISQSTIDETLEVCERAEREEERKSFGDAFDVWYKLIVDGSGVNVLRNSGMDGLYFTQQILTDEKVYKVLKDTFIDKVIKQ